MQVAKSDRAPLALIPFSSHFYNLPSTLVLCSPLPPSRTHSRKLLDMDSMIPLLPRPDLLKDQSLLLHRLVLRRLILRGTCQTKSQIYTGWAVNGQLVHKATHLRIVLHGFLQLVSNILPFSIHLQLTSSARGSFPFSSNCLPLQIHRLCYRHGIRETTSRLCL